jgi:hypothetical protein
MVPDLHPQPDLLDLLTLTLFTRLAFVLLALITEDAIVENATHRWRTGGRYFDEVKTSLSGESQGTRSGKNTELLLLFINDPHLGGANLVVDAKIVGYV